MIVLFLLLMLALPMPIIHTCVGLLWAPSHAVGNAPFSLPRLVLDYLTHLRNRVMRE
jgi:hypothetical protein